MQKGRLPCPQLTNVYTQFWTFLKEVADWILSHISKSANISQMGLASSVIRDANMAATLPMLSLRHKTTAEGEIATQLTTHSINNTPQILDETGSTMLEHSLVASKTSI